MNRYLVVVTIVILTIGYLVYTAKPSFLGKRIGEGISNVKARQECENQLIAYLKTTEKLVIRKEICNFLDKEDMCPMPLAQDLKKWVDAKIEECIENL